MCTLEKDCTLDVFSFVKLDYEIVDSSSFLKRCDECVSRKTKLEVCCIIIFCIRICLRLINQRERFIAITQTETSSEVIQKQTQNVSG